eukprot:scaffold925_cov129-Cylindrotheca_fusiformis.AAC.36
MIDQWFRSLFHSSNDEEEVTKCGKLLKRELSMTHCSEGDSSSCKRQYDVYIPSLACDVDQTRFLPTIFAVHCYGCSPGVMSFLTTFAEDYNFILVIPHGLKQSFNAQNCCGYALEHNVDDAGFFEHIITTLSEKYNSMVSKDFVYGFGWSNGGYMVARTANLFRAIAPVSGYQVDLPKLDRPVGLFMHHSETDSNVVISGCCNDPTMQTCCCGLSDYLEECESANDFFRRFGVIANQCTGKVHRSSFDQAVVEIGVTCYEAGSNCNANTTLCIHSDGGHFNRPSFESAFPMMDEVFNFFARNACEQIGDGSWSPREHSCICQAESNGGSFCLPVGGWEGNVHTLPVNDSSGPSTIGATFGAVLVVALLIFLLAKKERKYRDFAMVPTFELSDMSENSKAKRTYRAQKPE